MPVHRNICKAIALPGLVFLGLGAAAACASWPAGGHAASGSETNPSQVEVTSMAKHNSHAEAQASSSARATSSAHASASARASSSTARSTDGNVDCATEATASAESDGKRVTDHDARRVKGSGGTCSAEAHARAGDPQPDADQADAEVR